MGNKYLVHVWRKNDIKVFILDQTIGGPDASFSMTKDEFAEMVRNVRQAEKAIGAVDYTLTEKQMKGRDFCRSLYVVKDIKAGEHITEDNVRSIRPGFGMEPRHFRDVRGKRIVKNKSKGERLQIGDFE